MKSPLSWVRVVPCSDFDIKKTFSPETYEGFVPPAHFQIMMKVFDDVFTNYSHGKGVPAALMRSLVNEIDTFQSEAPSDRERQQHRKPKPVKVFDPTIQRLSDLEKSNRLKKRRISDERRKSSKRKKFESEDEEDPVEELDQAGTDQITASSAAQVYIL